MECPVCASERLSMPYTYNSFESHMRIPDGAKGMFGTKDLTVAPSLARVCLDCGYMMFFLGPDDLKQVQAAASGRR